VQNNTDFADVWVIVKGFQCPINNAPPQKWVPLFRQGAARAGATACGNNYGGNRHGFRPFVDV
jgi:hypothetical protein